LISKKSILDQTESSSISGVKSLPPVSDMMRSAGLEPKKALGQNFLFDLNLTRKIANSVPDIAESTVVEVGPGPGGLTRALLESGAKKVIAIEKDIATKPILSVIEDASDGRLEVIYGDALKEFQILETGFSICSNLPYNVGTELLTGWLHYPDKIKSMTLMFQREVAERIVARPGTKAYGRLSILTAMNWDSKILFNVPNTAFVPAPKVQSAIVQLVPKSNIKNLDKIEKLTAVLFGQRRKMIRSIMPNVDWTKFGLNGTERAEQLQPEMFIKIASDMN
jgi:16S rRNA (adenine1518-N6/adenine1519-N6)-dimethyltransferase